MIRLRTLQIANYKSLKSMGFDDIGSLSIFVGANNSGKSSVLQAMEAPLVLLQGNQDTFPLPQGASPRDAISDGDISQTATYAYEFDIEKTDVQADDRLAQVENGTVQLGITIFGNSFGLRLTHYSVGGAARASYQASNGSLMVQGGNFSPGSLSDQLKKPFTDASRLTLFDPLRLILNNIFSYKSNLSGSPRQVTFNGPGRLTSGTELARILYHWKAADDPRLAEYAELVDQVIPALGTIKGQSVGDGQGNIRLIFENGGREVNVADMGQGVTQALVLLHKLITRDTDIVLIEEPETRLHPGAQRALFSAIKAASRYIQIALTTHSPLLIDRRDVRNNFVFSLTTEQRTDVRRMRPARGFDYLRTALGLSIGDSLYAADVAILVDGWTEVGVIRALNARCEQSNPPLPHMDLDRVALIPVRRESELVPICTVVHSMNVPCIVRLDEYSNARTHIARAVHQGLIDSDDVVHLKCSGGGECETEDTLPIKDYLEALSAHYNLSISVEDFVTVQEDIAEQHGGHRPTVAQVCLKMLQDRNALEVGLRDYDKVDVALRVAEVISLTNLPGWYTELVTKTAEKLIGPGRRP